MIRYVAIGDQILYRAEQFAFYDTVTNRFLDFDGDQVFDSVEDFREVAATSPRFARCLRLIPEQDAATLARRILDVLPEADDWAKRAGTEEAHGVSERLYTAWARLIHPTTPEDLARWRGYVEEAERLIDAEVIPQKGAKP